MTEEVPIKHVYITDYGPVELPEKPPANCMMFGSPNRPFADQIYARYLRFVEELAGFAWRHHGRLKVAPPFTDWRRSSPGGCLPSGIWRERWWKRLLHEAHDAAGRILQH